MFREISVSVDLRLQIGDDLLCGGDGIGARNKPARRWLLADDDDQRACELRRIARLLAILGFPKFELLRSTLVVIVDGRLGVVRRLLRQKLCAEEPRIDDGRGNAERREPRRAATRERRRSRRAPYLTAIYAAVTSFL